MPFHNRHSDIRVALRHSRSCLPFTLCTTLNHFCSAGLYSLQFIWKSVNWMPNSWIQAVILLLFSLFFSKMTLKMCSIDTEVGVTTKKSISVNVFKNIVRCFRMYSLCKQWPHVLLLIRFRSNAISLIYVESFLHSLYKYSGNTVQTIFLKLSKAK